MASKERDSAVERLDAALVEQDRLSERFDAAVGTSTELRAYAGLQAAGEQVRAREAWVHWVEDEDYRGANAGPFELLSESRERRTTSGAARRRSGEMNRADGDRRAGQMIKARYAVPRLRVGGRAWLNGREVGGADPRYIHLGASHD